MKLKRTELEVDFIGGQEPLTTDEEKALSDFFKKRKSKSKSIIKTNKTSSSVSGFRQSSQQ